MEGSCFVKKWTFPAQNETKLVLDLFFILHFTYLGECVRTPCLQACHIGNPYAFGMEHQSYFLHRLSWVSLSAMLQFLHFEAHVIFLERIKIAISKFVCRFIAIDVDKHSNTETDTVITIIRSPYRGRSKNT